MVRQVLRGRKEVGCAGKQEAIADAKAWVNGLKPLPQLLSKGCDCPLYCKYCGAKFRRDPVGHLCSSKNCQWEHGVPGCQNGVYSMKTFIIAINAAIGIAVLAGAAIAVLWFLVLFYH